MSTEAQPEIEGTSLRLGDLIDGKYRVERVLGRGGMGLVLAAIHLMLGQKVAIKLLLPEMLANRAIVARFEREARAAATLRSDHVARVVDVGWTATTGPYMVMEFLEGCDLEDAAVESGPFPPNVAVNHVLQACEAIAEAHGLGIIHRDLKPQNLFRTRRLDGSPLIKVLDFGISKMATDPNEPSLTQTADVMGSPLYMSPEQLRGVRDVDTRTDLWALGAILYRLIAGRPPFDGANMAQLCTRVMMEDPPALHVIRPGVPEGLSQVVERCLRKDPAARFLHVAELARALDPFSSQQTVRAVDRVLRASNRPPELGPTVSAASVTTRTEKTASPAGRVVAVAAIFVAIGAAAAVGYARMSRVTTAPGISPMPAPSAVASPSSATSVSASPPPEPLDAGEPARPPRAAASASARPTRGGQKKAPPKKTAPAPTTDDDEAPDLRK